MIYYIDPKNGGASGGLSPETPIRDYRSLDPKPGDTLLFRRGSFIRDTLDRVAGTPDEPITYGAYGEGANPVFCGSVDVSSPDDWEEYSPNIWKYTGKLESEVCNFIFDNGRIGGTLCWEDGQLNAQGCWYDSHMGMRSSDEKVEERVLLYSVGNPGEVYSHIECAVWGKRHLSRNVSCTALEDLIFFGSGVHALAGGADHMTVRRCSFLFIGGAVWNRQLRIRFGNAIEFWERGSDILIEDCYFNNIYDSAITQQGGTECKPAERLVMRRNLFVNYGMAAYEGRDRMLIDSSFTDNLCVSAGGGFSGFGDTKPRSSEIYPQPMGHHLFMWRIKRASEGGLFEVARNRFYDAAGAAVYSIISPEAERQLKLSDNRYFTSNKKLLTHVGGRSYAPDEFYTYLSEYGEPGACLAKPDIESEISAAAAECGFGRLSEKLLTDKLPPRIYFIGSTERDALSYKAGEDIKFSLTLVCEGKPISCPKYSYICDSDDGSKTQGTVDGGEHFEYTASISRPGYVHLKVTPCGEDGKPLPGYEPYEGGACADFDEIRQAGELPEDFDAFWERVIKTELDPIKPTALEKTEFACGDPADIVYDMKIACPGKYPTSGYLRMPRNAEAGTLPIYVEFRGYGCCSASVPCKADAIQLSLNQHGIVNGRSPEFYQRLRETEFAGFGFDRTENSDPDTVYFKYMVLRALQAVRYCKTLPEWDGKNIILRGGSMGAFQSVSAAARDRDVTRLEINIPWLCDLRGCEHGRLRGWRPECDRGLDYFDTVSSASRVACETVITAGLGDYICPPSGVTSLYHAIKAPVTMTMLQNKTHPYTAPEYSIYTRKA